MTNVEKQVLGSGIALITLQGQKANVIDWSLVDALEQALNNVVGARGLVLTGSDRYFCAGLDLSTVFPLSREEMSVFMRRFVNLVRHLYTWPGPTVAAINGHALGGGFLLALACDRRFAVVDDHIRIGFPDVERQVPLSHSLRLMALHALPPDQADLVNGRAANFPPKEAAARGLVTLVDSAEGPSTLITAAQSWIVQQPPDYAARKAQRLAPLLAQLDALGDEDIEYFLEQWFAPETRAAFRKVWERVK